MHIKNFFQSSFHLSDPIALSVATLTNIFFNFSYLQVCEMTSNTYYGVAHPIESREITNSYSRPWRDRLEVSLLKPGGRVQSNSAPFIAEND